MEVINNYTHGIIEGLITAFHLCGKIKDLEKVKTILHELLFELTEKRVDDFMSKYNSPTYAQFIEEDSKHTA